MSFQVIYKTFWGSYIDFDNLISIGAPGLCGIDSDVVGFSMFFKDAKEPLRYNREMENFTEKRWVYPPVDRNRVHLLCDMPPGILSECPENGGVYLKTVDDGWVLRNNYMPYTRTGESKLIAVANLQKQIDDMVLDWEAWKQGKICREIQIKE